MTEDDINKAICAVKMFRFKVSSESCVKDRSLICLNKILQSLSPKLCRDKFLLLDWTILCFQKGKRIDFST